MSMTATIEAQGRMEPGTTGYWKVWGARPHNVRPGDVVLLAPGDEFELVEDTFTAKAAPMRVGLVIDGERLTIGALCPIIVLRHGDHNTLA
jgi:hypothetical protein